MAGGLRIGYGRAMQKGQPSRAELCGIIDRLAAKIQLLEAELRESRRREAELEAEVERLRGRPSPPSWVKKNTPARTGPKRPRKKRARNFARRRATPTKGEVHAVAECPTCGCALRGGTIKRHREVIEIELPPVVITDHALVERTCPRCGTSTTPVLGPVDGVVGQHRFGPRLLALITTWHESARMPVRTIQTQLRTLFGVHVSLGGIEDALHTTAESGADRVVAIRDEIRESPVVHADETSWREDGQNRYVWLIATPTARYFELGRRTNEQIDQILGPAFSGVLVCDFYAAYNHFPGEKQRCWAHLLRDIADLVDKYPDDHELATWGQQIRLLYRQARDEPRETAAERQAARHSLEVALAGYCTPWLGRDVPQRTLCQRIVDHLHELFTFVTRPEVPPTNNEAERALRPLVIARKVWGGTRSPRGSTDAMRRATLFHTWHVEDGNPFLQARQLLLSTQN